MQFSSPTSHIASTSKLAYHSQQFLAEHRRTLDPGVDAATEAKWRKTTANFVKEVISRLKLPTWVQETAMVYVHRFFMSRSLHRNDRFLVIGGAVLLSSKVQESPRSVDDVVHVCFDIKHANKKASWQQPHEKAAAVADFKSGVLLAEQCILFAINFNLVVPASLNVLRDVTKDLDLQPPVNPASVADLTPEEVQARLKVYRSTLQILQDSYASNLCLQYPPPVIAAVALRMAAKLLKKRVYAGQPLPSRLEHLLESSDWLDARGISPEQAQGIEAQIEALYEIAPSKNAATAAQQQQSKPQPEQLTSSAPQDKPSLVAAPGTPPAQAAPNQPDGSPEDGELVSDAAACSTEAAQQQSSLAAARCSKAAAAGNGDGTSTEAALGRKRRSPSPPPNTLDHDPNKAQRLAHEALPAALTGSA